jgi:drug/metabolite transporter (DMT)-like permease
MFSKQLQADLWLALVAMIWGATFVVVKNELAYIEPLAFVALRFSIAFLAMVLLAWRSLAGMNRAQLAAGILIGIFLFGGYALQTIGLRYTSASKAAFITGLSVVLAPLFARLLLRQTPSILAALGVVLATSGLGLLSMVNDLTPALGDLLILGCAACFALHIVTISHFAPKMDTTALATVQIGVVPIAASASMIALEPLPTTISVGTLGVAALMGVFATAFAFTIQTRAQAFTTPTHTALVLSLEPVFGAIFAYLLGGERLGGREIVGCALILAGMLVAEIKRER